MLKCISASNLYDTITGQSKWEETFINPIEDDEYPNLSDESLFDLMFEPQVEEDSREYLPNLENIFSTLKKATSVNENECSICYCEFDDVVVKLDCGHEFCSGCVSSYLRVKIAENPRFRHQKSIVTREGIAVVVKILDLVGVKCPHFNCREIIDNIKIRSIADEETYSKFDRFALDEALSFMQHKGYLNPCPLGCGYFTQEDCLCVNPDCRKKQLYQRKEAERIRLKNLENEKSFRDWASRQTQLVKLCPTCFVQIEKNGGCDHMYCTKCAKSFLWSQAIPWTAPKNQYFASDAIIKL
jgi:ariadne-1